MNMSTEQAPVDLQEVRNFLSTLHLPYPHLTMRIGAGHARGTITRGSQALASKYHRGSVVIFGTYIASIYDMLGVKKPPETIEFNEERAGVTYRYFGQDMGHALRKLIAGHCGSIERVLETRPEDWSVLEEHARLPQLREVVAPLLSKSQVTTMIKLAEMDLEYLREGAEYGGDLGCAEMMLHRALTAIMLATQHEIVTPFNELLDKVSDVFNQMVLDGVHRFVKELANDGLVDKEVFGKVKGWAAELIAEANKQLKKSTLPDKPSQSVIDKADNWCINARFWPTEEKIPGSVVTTWMPVWKRVAGEDGEVDERGQ